MKFMEIGGDFKVLEKKSEESGLAFKFCFGSVGKLGGRRSLR